MTVLMLRHTNQLFFFLIFPQCTLTRKKLWNTWCSVYNPKNKKKLFCQLKKEEMNVVSGRRDVVQWSRRRRWVRSAESRARPSPQPTSCESALTTRPGGQQAQQAAEPHGILLRDLQLHWPVTLSRDMRRCVPMSLLPGLTWFLPSFFWRVLLLDQTFGFTV